MLTTENSNLEAWLGVIVSSIACIIGASIVFIDILFHRPLLDSRAFMASSMSLASGVLLFSSLSIMFPQAQKRLQNDTLLYACYFAGITFTLLLTKLIHYLMPDAIHACGDGSDSCQDHDSHSHDERRKLSKHRCDAEYGTMRSSESHFILHYEDYQDNNDAQNEDNAHEHSHHHHHDPIENVVGNDPKHYLNIGIQTAIAICVHKFPEGLIMFVSTKASSALGLSVSIALSIHNLTEGFMIALPLYYATRSRMIAFSAASLMGGLSQPLGALVGLLLVKNISKSKEDVLFGAIFACISGMMSLITIQSMLPQAIRADMEQHYILLFFFLGIFIVGLSSVLGTL